MEGSQCREKALGARRKSRGPSRTSFKEEEGCELGQGEKDEEQS